MAGRRVALDAQQCADPLLGQGVLHAITVVRSGAAPEPERRLLPSAAVTRTDAPRVATIGVYGFSAETFLAALRRADVALLLDVRQRRGVRGSEYA